MFTCLAIGIASAQQPKLDYGAMLCQNKDDKTCPMPCRKDLSYIYNDIKLIRIPFARAMQHAPVTNVNRARVTLGMWMGPPVFSAIDRTIAIDSDISGWIFEAAKHHEACHEELYRITGSAKFHE